MGAKEELQAALRKKKNHEKKCESRQAFSHLGLKIKMALADIVFVFLVTSCRL